MAVWFAVGNIAVYFAALMCTHIAAFRTARNIRRAGVKHVLELPLGFFAADQSGRLRKVIDDNAALTEDLLAHKRPDLTAAAVTPPASVVLLTFDWRMGVLCLLTMKLDESMDQPPASRPCRAQNTPGEPGGLRACNLPLSGSLATRAFPWRRAP